MAHLSRIPDFPLLLRQDHTHPRTTPTRSMARTALSMPSPPPSAVLRSFTAIGSVLSPELPPVIPAVTHCGGVVSGSAPAGMVL